MVRCHSANRGASATWHSELSRAALANNVPGVAKSCEFGAYQFL